MGFYRVGRVYWVHFCEFFLFSCSFLILPLVSQATQSHGLVSCVLGLGSWVLGLAPNISVLWVLCLLVGWWCVCVHAGYEYLFSGVARCLDGTEAFEIKIIDL